MKNQNFTKHVKECKEEKKKKLGRSNGLSSRLPPTTTSNPTIESGGGNLAQQEGPMSRG